MACQLPMPIFSWVTHAGVRYTGSRYAMGAAVATGLINVRQLYCLLSVCVPHYCSWDCQSSQMDGGGIELRSYLEQASSY